MEDVTPINKGVLYYTIEFSLEIGQIYQIPFADYGILWVRKHEGLLSHLGSYVKDRQQVMSCDLT